VLFFLVGRISVNLAALHLVQCMGKSKVFIPHDRASHQVDSILAIQEKVLLRKPSIQA